MSDKMHRRLSAAIRMYPRDLVRSHRSEIIEIVDKHQGSAPRLFGSIARGTDTRDSDVDLLIDMAPGASLFDLVAIGEDLEELLGTKVDVISSGGLTKQHTEILRDAAPL